MTVKTKYNVGDIVYFFDSNKLAKGDIREVNIISIGNNVTIKYKVYYKKISKYYGEIERKKTLTEDNVNTSQEDLFESMKL